VTTGTKPVVPAHQGLRRAIAWLAEQGAWSPRLIEAACQRFDIAPADEDFLLAEYRRLHGPGTGAPPAGPAESR
jgi:hypothetical protein